MKTINNVQFAKYLAKSLADASRAAFEVLRNPHVDDAPPHTVTVDFIAMPFAEFTRRVEKRTYKLEEPTLEELGHELRRGYVSYNTERGTVYKAQLPRMPAVALLSPALYRALADA